MKDLTPELSAALAQNSTRLCRIWEITRKDGMVFRFTDHDRDITFDGNVYGWQTSFMATAVQTQLNSAGSDVDVTVLLAPGSLEYMHLQRGLFDEADTILRIVRWDDPNGGAIIIHQGRVNSVDLNSRQSAILQLVGPISRVNKSLTEKYSKSCRANFGDARCKFPLATVTTDYTVTAPGGNDQQFKAAALTGQPVDHWMLGTVEWLTGTNKGTRQEVAGNDALGGVNLLFRPPFPVAPGDTGKITRGCPKTLAACEGYANRANYRGEPFVPGDSGI